MIRYALICADEHTFESWFQSADAFEKLQSAQMITCPMCGGTDVRKGMMTPRVTPARSKAPAPAPAPASAPSGEAPMAATHALTAPSSPAEAALAELKKTIQETSEYVGDSFASEARKIHDGSSPERSIYGEASSEDARRLIDDGVPVAPLPFLPQRKTN